MILFQSTGLFLTQRLQLSYVRHEMKQAIKEGVPEDQRLLLKISKSTEADPAVFEWFHSKEFRYKGEMYDILGREQKGDTTYYTVIHDVKESGIFKNMDALVSSYLNGNPAQRKQRELFLGFFQKLYLFSAKEVSVVVAENHTLQSSYSDFFTDECIPRFFRPPSAPGLFVT